MKTFLAKLIMLILLSTISISANTIEKAKKFYENENYLAAIPILEKYPDNPESQYLLGKAYLYGLGIEKNEKQNQHIDIKCRGRVDY